MSKEALANVIERAILDPSFRTLLTTDPERALAGYDLSAEERTALLGGDGGHLAPIGLDARVSKAGSTSPEEQDAWIEWLRGLQS